MNVEERTSEGKTTWMAEGYSEIVISYSESGVSEKGRRVVRGSM